MAKVNTPLVDTNKLKPMAYSKRTIGGGNYTHNVRCVKLKSKRKKIK